MRFCYVAIFDSVVTTFWFKNALLSKKFASRLRQEKIGEKLITTFWFKNALLSKKFASRLRQEKIGGKLI